MSKIAFLVPHAPLVPFIKEVIAQHERVHVEHCPNYYEMVDFAGKLVESGYEIIIARAGTASRIRRSGLSVTVVELPVTGFDIVRALAAAAAFGPNIAVVAYAEMVKGIDTLIPFLGASVKQYLTDRDDAQVETMVLEAIRDGTDVVVGGGIFCQMAEKHGVPSVFIENGKEAILQAVEEALRIEAAIEAEKVKGSLFAAVLDYVHDGIITVDCDQKITSINLRAQKMLQVSPIQALGQDIHMIWPAMDLSGLIRTRQEEMNTILQVKDLKLICNKVPILANGNVNGALVTFQDVTKVQQAEAQIRKEMYNKGHVAKKRFADVWGNSKAITQTVALAKEYAATNSNILIVGETGTGKEVFAQSIHNHSPRQAGPFVAVNCAALPAQILESELFGYSRGAFTGASKEGKPGLFELAHGGTIFLDEIAEMDYTLQSRLLRVIQERSIMRLGSDRVIAVDVRVIAATNKDLKELVLTRSFREDLFFRLNVLKLELPPLRERFQDIPGMAENFIRSLESAGRPLAIDPQAMRALETYAWPGNVRELQNTIERLMAFCRNGTVHSADIDAVLEKWHDHSVRLSYQDEQIREITEALNKAKGIQSEAARLLGIDRTTLWRRMRRLGIQI